MDTESLSLHILTNTRVVPGHQELIQLLKMIVKVHFTSQKCFFGQKQWHGFHTFLCSHLNKNIYLISMLALRLTDSSDIYISCHGCSTSTLLPHSRCFVFEFIKMLMLNALFD